MGKNRRIGDNSKILIPEKSSLRIKTSLFLLETISELIIGKLYRSASDGILKLYHSIPSIHPYR